MTDPPNKLFFIVTFEDGTQIAQNVEDVGAVEGRNCYYDVMQKTLEVPAVCCVLAAEGYPTFGVDLKDGHFEVNGVPFFMHTEPYKDFRLQYFRNVTQHRQTNVKTGETIDTAEVGYLLGWECEYGGETITRVMSIK